MGVVVRVPYTRFAYAREWSVRVSCRGGSSNCHMVYELSFDRESVERLKLRPGELARAVANVLERLARVYSHYTRRTPRVSVEVGEYSAKIEVEGTLEYITTALVVELLQALFSEVPIAETLLAFAHQLYENAEKWRERDGAKG